MENYVEVNAITELLNELDYLLEAKHYLGALYLALTVPDSLGKIAYPKINKGRQRYIKWFDENVHNIFGLLYSDSFFKNGVHFDGAKCYQLRCALLHDSSNDISSRTKVKEFVLGFNDQRFFTGQLSGREYLWEQCDPETGNVPYIDYLYIGVKETCVDILEAAKCFLANNPNLECPKLKLNRGGGKLPKDILLTVPKPIDTGR